MNSLASIPHSPKTGSGTECRPAASCFPVFQIQLRFRLLPPKCLSLLLSLAFCLSSLFTAFAGTNDFLTSLRLDDRTLTNVPVSKVTERGVQVRHDGGIETVKRAELPPELQARCDAVAAARTTGGGASPDDELPDESPADAARARVILREQRGQVFADLVLRERRVDTALSAARTELIRLNEILTVQVNAAKGTGRHSLERQAVSGSRQRKIALISQIHALEDQLRQTREQQARFR